MSVPPRLIASLRLACAAIALVSLAADARADTPAAAAVDASPDVIGNSVVKIFGTIRYPDIAKPWSKRSPTEISGSGVVIEGNRILTNAHMVLYASDIQVQASESGDRVSASVEGVAPGIDVAVLKLDDESFFSTHPALKLQRALPKVKDPVVVYGYPTGGTSLSITKGIVSRIEYAPYNFPVSGLRIQIDAAINHGNSGGPAIVGNEVIGLAFSFLSEAQNIGYIIPTEEIELVLKGIEGGGYKGKFSAYDGMQTLENPALRKFLKLDPAVHGIVVCRPDGAGAGYPLKRWDVITKIGDEAIDDQGMIKLADDLRVQFLYRVPGLVKDGTVPIQVVREGKAVDVNLPVEYNYPSLFHSLNGAYPSYFILGPIVFEPVTFELLSSVDGEGMARQLQLRSSPLVTRRADTPSFDGEGLVVVSSPLFPSRLGTGYRDPAFRVVSAVNGTRVKNFRHLIQILRDSTDKFVVIEFADLRSEKLVFPRQEMIDSTDGILNDNGIRNQGSPDALAEWKGGSK